MKFSIVVPTYNRAILTKDCISSNIKNAGIPADRIEWIWVDDGSTDGVQEVMKKMCPDISVIRNYNLGIEKTVNQGYALATGDFIFKLDSDLLLPKNWLKVIDEHISKIPETAVIGILLSGFQEHSAWAGKEREINGLKILEANMVMGLYGFSRKMFKKVGYLNEDIPYYASSDMFWSDRAKKTGELMYYVDNLEALHLGSSQFGGDIDILDPERSKKDAVRRLNRPLSKQQLEGISKIYYNPFI